MCFSAPVSFAAAGILAATGTASVRRARGTPAKWFAAIPLLFSIQQLIEGFQWLSDRPSVCSSALGYGFLFFAFLLWPVYFPFAAMMMEKATAARRALRLLMWFGAAGSFSLLLLMLAKPMTVAVVGASLDYQFDVDAAFHPFSILMYVVATCGTGVFSTQRAVRVFAAAVFAAFLVSYLAFQYAFTSVWCFFGALLSVLIYVELSRGRRSGGKR